MTLRAILDWLRAFFPYAVALILPLAGLVLAGAKYAEHQRDEAWRLAALSLVGCLLWALALT